MADSSSLRGIRWKAPRGMTLSFFYHKQSRRMERVHRTRAKVLGEYEVRCKIHNYMFRREPFSTFANKFVGC